jgi:CheY-like chemotaxis protein
VAVTRHRAFATRHAMTAEQAEPVASSALNVLYVEDYPPSAALVRHALARRAPNIRLETVTTVAQAIERLNRFERGPGHSPLAETMQTPRFDTVLTDLNLPDGSGLDILAHVRDRRLSLAVVVMSSSTDDETAAGALRAGANAYLAKRDDYLSRLPQVLYAAIADLAAEAKRVSNERPPA